MPVKPTRMVTLLLPVLVALVIAACQGGTSSPSPTAPAPPSDGETHLLFGLREDARVACTPMRDGLPPPAIGGIECRPESELVSRVRLYLFETQQDLLASYSSRLEEQGIRPGSGHCKEPGGSDSAYLPGPEPLPQRQACFLDDADTGNYMATLPPFVLFEVAGEDADPLALSEWSWLGNQDTPGAPTVWRSSGPVDPEK